MIRGIVSVAVLVLTVSLSAVQQPASDALYQEARRLFDALDYERAVVALDQAIAALQGLPVDAARNQRLSSAYEMRARSKFGLGDQDGAKADFVSLLRLAPGHALSGQVSPRVVALFEETARDSVTNLTINLTPATATLQLDGVPLAAAGTIRVAVGEHVITAEQAGYRPAKETVTLTSGATSEVTVSLERVASVIRISTMPADVEVKIDGKVIGKTAALKEGDASAGSAPLIVADVETGTHTVELTRECFVPATQRVEVAKPDDYTIGPVTLAPAVASLTVTASQSGAQVFVDGRDRGVAPQKVSDLCEGEHVVDVRSPYGSDSRKVTIRAGSDATVASVLKPSYAIVSFSGSQGSSQDVRVIVERAFAASRTIALVAPAAAEADEALKANQLTAEWLAVDAGGRPVGAAAQIAGPSRKDVSTKLADAFHTQGVASVTMVDSSRAVVALLNAGSSTPDVIEVALDSPPSIAAAAARFDATLNLTTNTIGVQAIDVADVGVVVVGLDGDPAGSTLKVGDIVVQADGKPMTDVATLAALAGARQPGETIALDVRDAAGAPRRVELKVVPAARLIGLSEQGLLANRMLLDLRPRLTDAKDAFEQSVIRLNIAVALARLGDWTAAREELLQVKLPEQVGVGNGTVQYLLGVAADNLGNKTEAEAAFKNAASSESLLTENGPPVKELAEARLRELQKPSR
jgi:tetratricopeptide (TPR) repeat protein